MMICFTVFDMAYSSNSPKLREGKAPPGKAVLLLHHRGHVLHLDARRHDAADSDLLDVDALHRVRPALLDGVDEEHEVVHQALIGEAHLADHRVDVPALVGS